MDWYIFLAPLLLLPIIFLFRLVGCSQDFDALLERGDRGDGGPLINIKFVLDIKDPIPLIPPNPIYYIWPKFTIDAGEPIDYAVAPEFWTMTPEGDAIPPANGTFTPFAITSVTVPASPETHIFSCDVFITRLGIDEILDHPLYDGEHHLIGPQTVETVFGEISDNVITFNLNYTPPPSTTDYLASDFLLTPQPTGP